MRSRRSNDPTADFARHMRRQSGQQTVGEQLAVLGLYLGLMVPFALWSGFVLTRLWAWFAQPLGAPHLTLAPAIGVNLLVTFLVARASPLKPDESYMQRAVSFAVFDPAFALGIGYVVHLFT